MEEIAVRDSPVPFEDPTGGRLVAWAKAAHAANQLAVALCRTAFAPQQFRDNPDDTTAAILAGDELGLSPIAAMRSIYVVHGTPALYSRTMVALVQSRGHELWTEKSTDESVTVCGKRRGSTNIEKATWTIARAQRAGYTANKKYQSNPAEMLYAKAAAEVCRRVAADVLLGVPTTVEDIELEDGGEPAPTRKISRRLVAAPIVVEQPEPTPEPPPEPELITDPQSKKLHILLRENDMADRDIALAWIEGVLDVPIATTKDLTKDQASRLIDNLSEPALEVGDADG